MSGPRARRQERIVKRLRFGFFLLSAAALAFGLLVVFINHPRLAIREVVVLSARTASEESAARQIVSGVLGGRYGGIFSKGNFFLLPRGEVTASLLERLPALRTPSLSRDKQRLFLDLNWREPIALWCAGQSPILTECYLMDREAVYDRAPLFSRGVLYRYYGPIDARTPLPIRPVSQEKFAKLEELRSAVSALGLKPGATEILSAGDIAIVFEHAGAATSTRLLVGHSADPALTAERLRLLITSADFSRVAALENNLEKVEYIDMRYSNKAFYKLK